MIKRRFLFTFPPDLVKEPIIHNFGHQFNIFRFISQSTVGNWGQFGAVGFEKNFLEGDFFNDVFQAVVIGKITIDAEVEVESQDSGDLFFPAGVAMEDSSNALVLVLLENLEGFRESFSGMDD